MAEPRSTPSGEKQPEPKVWEPPSSDQEFEFKDIDSAPAWIDKGWAGYDQGPALQLPQGDALFGEGPYTTQVARVGDKVQFVAATPSRAAHFVVIQKEPTGENATIKIPQVTNASLEDMLKGGTMAPDDLGPDAKAQVVGRSPKLKQLVEEGKGAPKAVPVTEVVKTS